MIKIAVLALAGFSLNTISAYADTVSSPRTMTEKTSDICFLSPQDIYTHTKVGQAATLRLKQLTEEAQTEIDTERKPIDEERQKLQQTLSRLSAQEREDREKLLFAKVEKIRTKANHRAQEIEATRIQILRKIASEAEAVITASYQQSKCNLLLDHTAVIRGSTNKDITASVIQGLDAKIQSIAFNREVLTPQSKL